MNPGKFVVGTAAILAFCLTSPMQAQIAGFGGTGTNWTLNAATNSTDAPSITNNFLFMGPNSGDSVSAYYDTVQYMGNFTASFVFHNAATTDDAGFAFVLQNDAVTAVGTVVNNNLGYVGVTSATGIAFDIDPQGNGPGLGYAPIAIPAGGPTGYIQTGGVNFRGVNPIAVNILYTNDVLNVTVTDLITSSNFTTNFNANLTTAVGANTAFVGFSAGGIGGLNVTVSNFVFNSVAPNGTPISGSVGLTNNGAIADVSMVSANESDGVIALNPAHPNQLFIAGNTNASFNPGLFSKYSTNSGTNWLPGSLTNLPAGYNPAVAWDGYGNLFLAYADTINLGTDIAFSTNGGQTFLLLTNFVPGHFTSEQRIAVGSGPALGSLWAFYHDFSIPSGPLVVQGSPIQGFGSNAFGSFGPVELVPGATNNCGYGDIAVGSSGQVMVTYQNNISSTGSANIYVSEDPDGLGSQGFRPAVLATANGIGGNTHIPAAPDALGLNSSAGLAWDTTPSDQHFGRAYLVFTGAGSPTPNDLEIFMVTSDDNGATWTPQTQVNDDFTQNSKFMPRLALDPVDGAVAVSWYDCRNDLGYVITQMTNVVMTNVVTTNNGTTLTNMETVTNVVSLTNTDGTVDKVPNDDAELYLAVTLDGGLSFTHNLSMSTNPSESFLALNFEEESDYGDYNGLAYYGLNFYPVWSDNSTDFPSPTNPDGPTNKFDIAFGSGTFTGTSTSAGVTGLSVTTVLTNTPNPLQLGSTIQYLVTVSNAGPASAPQTTLTDSLSPFLANIKGIPSTNNDSLSGDTLTWPVGTLAPGGTASILIHGIVVSLGNITNIAAVASPKVVNLFTNNSVFTLITPVVSPDLSLTMIGSVPIISLTNQTVTYTMTVTNLQPITATGVTLSNSFPTNLALLGMTYPAGTLVSTNQTNLVFQLGTMTNGQTFTVSLTAIGVSVGFATNTAVVFDTYVDPNPTNNTATQVTQISSTYVPPVFALGITGSPTNIGGDQEVVYTFNVTNVGTVNSPDVLLAESLSSNLFFLTASLPNISTNANSNIGLFDLGALATNQSTSMTVTAAGFAIGQAINIGVAADALGEGSVTNQIVTPVVPPVLSVSLAGTPALIAVGQTLTNTLNITNTGTVPAYALTISYTVPTNLSLQGITQLGVTGDLSTNQNILGCEVHELDPGQVATLVITTTGLSVGKATNSVVLFANFSSNYLAQLVTPIDAPDMSLSITGSPSTLPVGQQVTYTLTVKNLGPVPAYGVVVTNALQSDLTLAGVTTSQGTFSNLLNVVYGNIGTMAINQTVTLHVTATANTAAGSVVSTGYVFANSLPDPNPANNLATVTTTITNAPLPYNLVVVPGVTSAFITWNTPYGATDQVDYGLTTAYGSASYLNTNLNTRHVVLLTGLLPDTNYFFQARSITSGLLSTTNGSFATVSSLTLGSTDASYSGVWTADSAATSIYPTNTPGSIYYYSGGVTGNPTASATYVPNIPTAGNYDVYLWYPGRSAVSSNTPVIVTGTTNAVFANVNQRVNSGSWQLVAPSVYYTNGSSGSVVIYNNSGDTTTSVLANAVRWSYNLSQDAPTNGSVPAWWANFYFGGNVSGAADADGDGFSNYAEYVLGTDPTSAASSLQFSATPGAGAGTTTVTFAPYEGGRLYQLLSNTNINLLTGWQTLTNTPTVNASGVGVFNVKAPAGTAVFYRLSVSLTSPQ